MKALGVILREEGREEEAGKAIRVERKDGRKRSKEQGKKVVKRAKGGDGEGQERGVHGGRDVVQSLNFRFSFAKNLTWL